MPNITNGTKKTRILSIDMGIKNMAFCVADISSREMKLFSNKASSIPKAEMQIAAWRRFDVAEKVGKWSASPAIAEGGSSLAEATIDEEEGEGPYTPSALSKTAYNLLKHVLLPYKPDIILIERQRWRSTGSPSIQQWTVRVNTLEGMLWAILTALREERDIPARGNANAYDIYAVDPKRVGTFWIRQNSAHAASPGKKRDLFDGRAQDLGPEDEIVDVLGNEKTLEKKLSRNKAEKKAKIQLLRFWLAKPRPSANADADPTSTEIEFTFTPEAEDVRAALCVTGGTGRGRAKKITDLNKMDDVTDCFLQAAAWVAWEGNRVKIANEQWDVDRKELRTKEGAEEKEIRTKIRKTPKPKVTVTKKEKRSKEKTGVDVVKRRVAVRGP
jgi:cruciform cutting endonuclease 1